MIWRTIPCRRNLRIPRLRRYINAYNSSVLTTSMARAVIAEEGA